MKAKIITNIIEGFKLGSLGASPTKHFETPGPPEPKEIPKPVPVTRVDKFFGVKGDSASWTQDINTNELTPFRFSTDEYDKTAYIHVIFYIQRANTRHSWYEYYPALNIGILSIDGETVSKSERFANPEMKFVDKVQAVRWLKHKAKEIKIGGIGELRFPDDWKKM
jgi:hypothetical protein